MAETAAIQQLLRQTPLVWRGYSTAEAQAIATGFTALDRLLPGRGWPVGALTELAMSRPGIGELRLLLPALCRLAREDDRPVVLVKPPHIPYAPALARAGLPLSRLVWIETASDDDAQWAAEQTLRAGIAGAVLLWSEATADLPLRRLQLTAQEGNTLAFLFRSLRGLRNPSPAAVRLALHPAAGALRVEVVKARGGHGGTVLCPLRQAA
jgi:hypothetical protein